MTFQDLFEKGLSIAKEIGEIVINALGTLYAKDIEVIGKYVLLLVIAGLLILGLRLLSDEVEEYQGRGGNEPKKLPWYLQYRTIFLVIIFLYVIIFVLIV